MLTPEQLRNMRQAANGIWKVEFDGRGIRQIVAHIDAQQANIAELEAKWLAEREAYLQERNKCEQMEENALAHKLAMQAGKAMLQTETERADRAERALHRAGFTCLDGATEWKPPLGPSASPLLDRITELEQSAARYRWLLHQAWFQEAFDRFDPDDGGMQDRFEKCVAEIVDNAMQK